MRLAICFTNFGPYHLARLRALGQRMQELGGELIAIETAGRERRYPWQPARTEVPYRWITLFPDRAVEDVPRSECCREIWNHLERERPDAVLIVGYTRPESLAMLSWAERRARPRVLLSESQAIDRPHLWWKEVIKSRRVRRFQAALVGGSRHRDYLSDLGLPPSRIVLGYNAVDHEALAAGADLARARSHASPIPGSRPYFLAANRFVAEKNLVSLVRAFAASRTASESDGWDLVLCGDGPMRADLECLVSSLGIGPRVHFPGFLQEDALVPYYAHASAFVHPSRVEPWGLVVNEAAACGLPLLVSERAGCVETLVPDPGGTTGRRLDPGRVEELIEALDWMSRLPEPDRRAMGERARRVASSWGPSRFASGACEAVEIARTVVRLRRRERSAVLTALPSTGNGQHQEVDSCR